MLAITLAAITALLCACPDSGKEKADAPKISRVDAVAVPAADAKAAQKWCDVSYTAADAPAIAALPSTMMTKPAQVSPKPKSWTWLNLWATWCKPCVREMPLLVRWRELLVKQGVPFDVVFLSVDEEEAALKKHLQATGWLADETVMRLNDPNQLGPWLANYKLDANSGMLPIQVIIDPDGKVRCLKAGSIGDSDWRTVQSMIH